MLAKDGIDRTDAVIHFNQHDYFYYLKVSGYTLTRSYMMNHGNMVAQFTAWAAQNEQAAAAGKPFVLGEMAVVGPQGLADITDVFGCALFTLDFLLYTASISISHVLFHMTDIGNQSAWQPITVGGIAPWVRPAYYAHIITSTLIGPNNDTRIAEVDVRNQLLADYAGQASSYVVYHGDHIFAAVLINLKEFNQTDAESTNTQLNFTLNVPPAYASDKLTVLKLSAPGADSFKGVTWAGINYQTTDGIPVAGASNDTTFVTVSSTGQFSVLVRDSQAAVVLFNSSAGLIISQATTGTPNASTTRGSTTAFSTSADRSGSGFANPSSAASLSYTVDHVIFLSFVLCIVAIVF